MSNLDTPPVNHREAGTYKGTPFKSKAELEGLAQKVIDMLRRESLPIWQVREVLSLAREQLDWVVLTIPDGTLAEELVEKVIRELELSQEMEDDCR